MSAPEGTWGCCRRGLPGLAAVFATYFHFLLWAQFGFLELLKTRLGGPGEVRLTMAAMGAAGLAASFAAALALRRSGGPRLVAAGLLASAGLALASLGAHGLPALACAAAATGAAAGLTTVALAASLGSLLPAHRLGLAVGIGTGLAYLLCNVPALFEAPPAVRACAAALACTAAGAWLLVRRAGFEPSAGAPLDPVWFTARGLAGAVVAFLFLVGLDSAAFAVVQQTPALKALTWGAGGLKLLIGVTHLGAAVAAGLLLNRGRFALLPAASFALFAVAFVLLGLTGGGAWSPLLAGPLYAVGISFYSVALVVLPASGAGVPGTVAPRWRAALLFGLAGWVGSALGVGMAQDLGRIPPGILAAVGGFVALALWAGQRRLGPVGRLTAAAAAGLLLFAAFPAPAPVEGDAVARGRAVYIAEGCIHCHSQYVRPAVGDVRLWGPYRPLDRLQRPVLLGNRRQGPDLMNVANRRSPVWQRLHLRDPRAVVPGSRMPAYGHLFSGDGRRGEDLVAYLGSLGAGTEAERAAEIAAAPLPAGPGDAEAGRLLFGRYCAPCHGDAGRGDGPLAKAFASASMDLTRPRYAFLRPEPEGELPALERAVRYGIPKTRMAGHEWLTDGQVADLAAYALSLKAGGGAASGTAP